jgi:hypothetical protein
MSGAPPSVSQTSKCSVMSHRVARAAPPSRTRMTTDNRVGATSLNPRQRGDTVATAATSTSIVRWAPSGRNRTIAMCRRVLADCGPPGAVGIGFVPMARVSVRPPTRAASDDLGPERLRERDRRPGGSCSWAGGPGESAAGTRPPRTCAQAGTRTVGSAAQGRQWRCPMKPPPTSPTHNRLIPLALRWPEGTSSELRTAPAPDRRAPSGISAASGARGRHG